MDHSQVVGHLLQGSLGRIDPARKRLDYVLACRDGFGEIPQLSTGGSWQLNFEVRVAELLGRVLDPSRPVV